MKRKICFELDKRQELELERYINSQRVRPKVSDVMREALAEFIDSCRPKTMQTEIPTPVSMAPESDGEKSPLRIKRERDLPLEGVAS